MLYGVIDYRRPLNPAFGPNRGIIARYTCLPNWAGREWIDLTGRHAGTLTGMNGAGRGWRGTMRPGGSAHMLFDSAAGYVSVDASAAFRVQAHSISMWMSVADITHVRILAARSASIAAGGFEWSVNNANFAYAYYDGAVRGWYTGPALVANTMYHLVGTWTPGTVKFYVNGVLKNTVSTTSGTITNVAGDLFEIGRQAANDLWSGWQDDVTLWDHTLSAGDVWAHYTDSRLGHPQSFNWVRPAVWSIPVAGSGHLLALRRKAIYA